MKRVRQHQIGTEAINAIKNIIPSTWIVNELKDDYGIDLMVEIVEKENTTGKIFFIQSKGTDAEILDTSFKYQLEYEHIKDYGNIADPILFISYSTKTGLMWGKWVNNLVNIVKLKSDDQKTVTIKFDKSNIINSDFFLNLPLIFSIGLPQMINITSNPSTALMKKIDDKIRKWIHHYYADKVAFDNHLLASSVKISYEQIADNNIKAEIHNNVGESWGYNIDPQDQYYNKPIFDASDCHISLKKHLIFVSKLLYKLDVNSTLDIVESCLDEVSDDVFSAFDLFQILIENVNTRTVDFNRIKKLSESIIRKNRPDLLQMVNMAIILSKAIYNEHYRDLYNTNLLSGLHISDNPSVAGALCYNLANSYRSNDEYHLASEYYQSARKYEPDYLTRHYWWQEYAGVLYQCGHYKMSEWFYKRAYELASDRCSPIIFDLIADTLSHQGRFVEALKQYEAYLKWIDQHQEAPNNSIILKHRICRFLISNGVHEPICGHNAKIFNEEELNEDNINLLIKEIEANPLNTTNWFNVGIIFSKIHEWSDAMCAFLACWYLDEGDEEALRNAFFMSFQIGEYGMLTLIISVIYDKFGVSGFNNLVQEFYLQPDLGEEHKEQFAILMHELYEQYDSIREGVKAS